MASLLICKLFFFASIGLATYNTDSWTYSRPGFVPPKKPYGFEALQNDVLNFAVRSLVPNGRLSMWMPTTNDEKTEFPVPMHENLEIISISVQSFNTCK